MVNSRDKILLFSGIILLLILFTIGLKAGAVEIPFNDILSILSGEKAENSSWSFIIENRLFRSTAAIFGGAALALCGLILQVYFQNPLAGPGVLGISSGASLGVAFVLLGGLSTDSIFGQTGILLSGITGAICVLLLLLFISRFLTNVITLLVLGLMISYFTSAIINVLFLWADLDETRAFVIWGLGSFEGLSASELISLIITVIGGIVLSVFLIKPLNALSIGNEYASSLGVNLKSTKYFIIFLTGVLTAIVTVYCGPISFVGIAVPQLIRMLITSSNPKFQIPAVIILGSTLTLSADLIVRFANNSLPLNTVTALIGAPIIIYTIIKINKKIA